MTPPSLTLLFPLSCDWLGHAPLLLIGWNNVVSKATFFVEETFAEFDKKYIGLELIAAPLQSDVTTTLDDVLSRYLYNPL